MKNPARASSFYFREYYLITMKNCREILRRFDTLLPVDLRVHVTSPGSFITLSPLISVLCLVCFAQLALGWQLK